MRRGSRLRPREFAAGVANVTAFIRAFVALVAVVAVGGGVVAYSIVRRGLSARAEPSRVEELVARTMRGLATPSRVRSMANPVERTTAVLTEGLEHYSDHCAACHANDGSGDTDIGRGLYPPPPDMRAAATQELSDGELFSIIENGVRLTGMPAWGTGAPEGERASWVLVHFIRRLPKLTDEEISRMDSLNPRTADEWREEEDARRFLAGEEVESATTPPHQHEGSQP
jgi:mono/diheme cytochrome c family protein